MSLSGRSGGGIYIPPITTEDNFANISQRLESARKIINRSVIETKIFYSIHEELRLLQIKIGKQPNEPRYVAIKEKLGKKLCILQKYVIGLQEGINQLVESDNSNVVMQEKFLVKKSSEQKGVNISNILPEDILLLMYSFLTARDVSRASGVCKFFKEDLYHAPLRDQLVFLSQHYNLVLKLADFKPSPTLGEFNQARRQAINSSLLSFSSTNLKKTPLFLEGALKARLQENRVVKKMI